MTITIYGIKSCSTMKKAFTKLDALGVSYDFHDYKKQGIDDSIINGLSRAFIPTNGNNFNIIG